MTFQGGCRCGAVRIAVDGPIRGMLDCHCDACRKLSGGGPAHLIQVAAEDFRIARGAPKAYDEIADSGALVTRYFCEHCGAPIYSTPTRFPGLCVIKAGVFDKDPGFAAKAVIWTEAATGWDSFPDGAQVFEKGSSD